MSLASFEPAAIGFCVALAAFLLGCLLAAMLTEPVDDPFSDAAEWDGPTLPEDLKVSLFHSERK